MDKSIGRKRVVEHDMKVAMCGGLVERKAKRVVDNEIVCAEDVTKVDGPFYCSECLSDVIVRKCVEKEDHFAHKANLSPLFASGESQLHRSCKEEILIGLREQYPNGNWEVERPIKGNKEKGYSEVVPDLSGRINEKPIVIEVQRSFLNIKTILKRTKEYRNRGVAILWIVPLKNCLPKENFRPRLFEKFLHSMYYGRVYYWQHEFGSKVLPVHFQTMNRYIEESTWFNVETQEKSTGGGYWKAYKTIKELSFYDHLIDIGKDFFVHEAKPWEQKNEDLNIPLRLIYIDKSQKWWID